jgi:hypothetical protein
MVLGNLFCMAMHMSCKGTSPFMGVDWLYLCICYLVLFLNVIRSVLCFLLMEYVFSDISLKLGT